MSTPGSSRRQLGLFSATAAVIATMIGAGIFGATGGFAFKLGTGANVLMVWIFCGLLALTGALSLGELGCMMPRAGGCYVYTRRIYGPTAGYLSGVLSSLLGFVGAMAFITLMLGHYVQQLVPALDPPITASAAVIFFSLIHSAGLREGTWVNNIFTVFKVGVILAFIIAGYSVAPQVVAMAGVVDPGVLSPPFATAMVSASFGYLGWETTTWIGGEVRNPNRVLPWSLVAGTLFVMVLYLLMNGVYLRADSPAAMFREDSNATVSGLAGRRLIYQPTGKPEWHWIQFSTNRIAYTNSFSRHGTSAIQSNAVQLTPDPNYADAKPTTIEFPKKTIQPNDTLGGTYAPNAKIVRVVDPEKGITVIGLHAANRLFSGNVSRWFNLMVVVVLLSTTSTIIMVGGRILYAMAQGCELPAPLGRNNRRDVPANALAVQAVATLIFIWAANNFQNMDTILIYIGLPLTVIMAAAVVGVMVLRHREPSLERPFRVPLYPLPPILFTALAIWMVVFTIMDNQATALGAAATVAVVWALKPVLTKKPTQPPD
jgi:amino acid transporter